MELPVTVLFLTSDLMFSSRVTGAAKQFGVSIAVVGTRAKLEQQLASEPVAMVLVDLEHREAVPTELSAIFARSSPRPKTIAYGPHVKENLLAAAQAAGFDFVMSRGQFDKQIGSLFQTLASSP